ncbi:MAG: RsmE family RNA methyltransferase, partial [Desulforhabdus sp.]|nr:RsmE family RNA methyltransferase [Desulforhabdus sp.]
LALEGAERSGLADIRQSFPECSEVLAVIGPEGGWSSVEVQELLAAGFCAVHLGPRILRLETAAVAFIALTQLLWGDFGSRT